jgi:hypothetical protein
MKNIVGNCIQKRNQNSLVERGRQRPLLQCRQDLGFESGDEGKITTAGVQGKDSLHASSSSNNESHIDE